MRYDDDPVLRAEELGVDDMYVTVSFYSWLGRIQLPDDVNAMDEEQFMFFVRVLKTLWYRSIYSLMLGRISSKELVEKAKSRRMP